MNHHHRDLRRSDIPSSLRHHIGRSPTEPTEIERLVRKARRQGVLVFLPGDLERMPDVARMLIEGEHKRICEGGRR